MAELHNTFERIVSVVCVFFFATIPFGVTRCMFCREYGIFNIFQFGAGCFGGSKAKKKKILEKFNQIVFLFCQLMPDIFKKSIHISP